MLKKIILTLAEAVDEYTEVITKIITFVSCVFLIRAGIDANGGNAPVVIIAVVSLIIAPILYMGLTILMVIIQLICHIGLMFYHSEKREDEKYSQTSGSQEYKERTDGASQNKSSQNEDNNDRAGASVSYADALRYFGLACPFSEEELKIKYHIAMKKVHPDAGGSVGEAKKVNMYYAILKRMC